HRARRRPLDARPAPGLVDRRGRRGGDRRPARCLRPPGPPGAAALGGVPADPRMVPAIVGAGCTGAGPGPRAGRPPAGPVATALGAGRLPASLGGRPGAVAVPRGVDGGLAAEIVGDGALAVDRVLAGRAA